MDRSERSGRQRVLHPCAAGLSANLTNRPTAMKGSFTPVTDSTHDMNGRGFRRVAHREPEPQRPADLLARFVHVSERE
jgi:hypothetical protein